MTVTLLRADRGMKDSWGLTRIACRSSYRCVIWRRRLTDGRRWPRPGDRPTIVEPIAAWSHFPMTFSVSVTALIFVGAILFTLGLGAGSPPLIYLAVGTFVAAGLFETLIRRAEAQR